ncbi:MAG: hypothetical protein ABUL69_06155, partial [Peristeroidobacter soli]
GAWVNLTQNFPANTAIPNSDLAVDEAGNAMVAYVVRTPDNNLTTWFSRYQNGSWSTPQQLPTSDVYSDLDRFRLELRGNVALVEWLNSAQDTEIRYRIDGTTVTYEPLAGWDTTYGMIDAQGNIETLRFDYPTMSIIAQQQVKNPVASFTIPAGATWASLATTLYGTAAVADDLQRVLGNPALTAGTKLRNLPATLVDTYDAPVSPYYRVNAGDTWASITMAVYGTDNAGAIAALQSATGNPTLTANLQLTVPATISYLSSPGAVVARTDLLSTVETQYLPYTLNTSLLTTPPGGWGWAGPVLLNEWNGTTSDPYTQFNAN